MKLLRLALRNYRGVTDAEIVPARDGITVIEADNEAGKSSFCEALDVLLNLKASTRSKLARLLQPVDRDVGPEIEAEFEAGELRFTYRKRYLRKPETVLDIQRPRSEQLRGDEAHERVDELLADILDKDLWNALRIAQAEGASQAALADQKILSKALDRAASAQGDSDDSTSHDVFALATAEFEHYYTSGKHLERPVLQRTRADLEAAAMAAVEYTRRLDDLDADIQRLERCKLAQRELAADITRLEADAAKAGQRLHEVEGLEQQLATAETELERARAADQRMRLEAQRHQETLARLFEQRGLAANKRELLATLQTRLENLRAQIETLRQAESKSRLAASRASLETAERRYARLQAQADYAALRASADACADTMREHAELTAALAEIRVDEAALVRLRKLELTARDARSRLESASFELDIEALEDTTLRLEDETTDLATGAAHTLRIDRQTTLQIGTSVRLELRPSADLERLRVNASDGDDAFRRALDALSVNSVNAAHAAHKKRGVLEERAAALAARGEALRRALPEDADARLATLAANGGAAPAPPDLDRQLRDARQTLDPLRARLRDDQQAAEAGQRSLAALEKELEQTRRQRVGSAQDIEWLERDIKQAEESLEHEPSADSMPAAATRLQAATTAVVALRKQVEAADADNARAQAKSFEDGLLESRDRHLELAAEARELDGRLHVREADGLFEMLSQAATAQVAAEAQLDKLLRKARAAATLFDALKAARRRQREHYARPLRAAIERFGKIVFGPDFEVEVDAQLQVTQRKLDGKVVPYASLSHGAREQLGVLLRLAVATLVAADEPPPVLFDDVLAHSDAERIPRMNRALAAASDQLQILVFTCMPSRFQSVRATRIQLIAS